MNWIIRHHNLFVLCGLFGLFSLVYFPAANMWWFGLIAFLGLLGFLAGRIPAPSHG
jgi:hypothetical protein